MNNDEKNSISNDNTIPFKKKKEPEQRKEEKVKAINVPPLTLSLFLFTTGVFLVQYFSPSEWDYWLIRNLGFIPAQWTGFEPFTVYTPFTLMTHMFLHGGWVHLLMNAFMLIAFGAGLEKMIGQKKMLFVFFVSGLAGALTQFLLDPSSVVSIIGASGALSGLFGALLILLQQTGGLGQRTNLKPFIFLWIGISIVFGIIGAPGGMDNIAWAAHVGGFLAGLLIMKFMLKKKK